MAGRSRGDPSQTKRKLPEFHKSASNGVRLAQIGSMPGFSPGSWDMELPLQESTSGGVGVGLDPAHLLGLAHA